MTTYEDRHDRRLALHATGLLAAFNAAGVLDAAADVHAATRLGAILEETDERVLLAVALAVRATRNGAICVDLAAVADAARDTEETESLDWPEPASWVDAVAGSVLVREQVLRLEGSTVYLDRYWREERQVCDDVVALVRREPPEVDASLLAAGLDRVFPDAGYDEQRAAVRAAAGRWLTVLTGGPGTGKTTAVAGLLVLLAEQHEQAHGTPPRIALCAPTGKAAARLQQAVGEAVERLRDPGDRARLEGLRASTLHRLLGWRPGSSIRFKHDRANRLPHDVIVVDETSMVSLTMMARLLESLRPGTRLVLVGDKDQLASVEAGAVLADLVDGFAALEDSPVAALRTTHRFGARIGELAEALRAGDAATVVRLLREGGPDAEVELVDPADEEAMDRFRGSVTDVAVALREAAEHGDAAKATRVLDAHRLLCAHRRGPYGVTGWNRLVEQLAADRTGVAHYQPWYAGRPVLVTANDIGLGLNNGDTGVTVRTEDGRLRVFLDGPQGERVLATTRLPEVETLHAMTVHKAQGSQATTVSVVLPPDDSPLLTRELFYTAVTRAQEKVRIVGTETAITAAVAREVQRASGLTDRLRAALSSAE
ncbi:MAG: exodeoxyribonuclease V subunit alpha [Nocardioidaceae bacterium]|nr:exodeoxyribonuclease V subunit alpha [Nocardioidaceae bacterium]